MDSCPNIGGQEINRRMCIGYFGLFLIFCFFTYVLILEPGHIRGLVIFPALMTTIPLLEVKEKTCIVNAYFGIKNMGEKYERERDTVFLKKQRSMSLVLTLKGIFIALGITGAIYLV
jgi:hypothetical protein